MSRDRNYLGRAFVLAGATAAGILSLMAFRKFGGREPMRLAWPGSNLTWTGWFAAAGAFAMGPACQVDAARRLPMARA